MLNLRIIMLTIKVKRVWYDTIMDIRRTVYKGESERWIGTITLKEHEHILTADGRILNREEWINAGLPKKLDESESHIIYPRLKYKKADITGIDKIRYHIVKPGGFRPVT